MKEKIPIRKLLKHAPVISAPLGLKEKLQASVNLRNVRGQQSIIRSWFAPSGKSVSFYRVAVAALIALVFLIPFSYGATKIVEFIVIELTVVYDTDENAQYITAFSFHPTVRGDCLSNTEDAKIAEKEMIQLIKEGKAEEISPGEYKAMVSFGGEVIYDTLGIPIEILESEDRQEKLKELTDEIQKLRNAGNFERTILDNLENVGKNKIKVRLYKESFILSNNKTITLISAYEIND
jgi:hypothetical protein